MDEEKRQLLAEIRDAFRRSLVHYGLWFNESAHQLGLEAALELEAEAGDKLFELWLNRLSKTLGFGLEQGAPAALAALPKPELEGLLDALAKLWLATDGVWFQSVEARTSIYDAKRVNDTCWTRFSPYEAVRIRRLLGLPAAQDDPAPLETLKLVLAHRLYSRLNLQDVVEETPRSFVFRMTECRVQAARRRKGLPDYDCRSGGQAEYSCLAKAVHPGIRVRCLDCPSGENISQDERRKDWYCAWEFFAPE
jgi:hypothetical protein